jgi:hypothetical protein
MFEPFYIDFLSRENWHEKVQSRDYALWWCCERVGDGVVVILAETRPTNDHLCSKTYP